MSNSTWKINDRTNFESAGSAFAAGFIATADNRTGKVEAKITLQGPACSHDVESVRREIIDVALKLTADLPQQQQRRDIEARIAEAKEQEKRLGELRLLYTTAKAERDAFDDYTVTDAGQQLVQLGRKVDDLKHQIEALGDPSAVLSALQSQLANTKQYIASVAKTAVTKQAIGVVADKLLAKRAALLRQLEAAVSPILDELAATDIQYTQVMFDANPMSGTIPREIEAAIKQAVGADDASTRINPVPTSPAMAGMPAVPANPQRRCGILPDGSEQRRVVGVQS